MKFNFCDSDMDFEVKIFIWRNTKWISTFLTRRTGFGMSYRGDYYLPCLKLSNEDEEQQPIGIWGQRHLRYLKQHRRIVYTELLTSGRLNGYLADIDREAEKMFSRLVNQMAEDEGITEKLKADDMMTWVGKMNGIRSRAAEIVNAELIFA